VGRGFLLILLLVITFLLLLFILLLLEWEGYEGGGERYTLTMCRWPLRISPRRAAFGGLLCLILLTGGAVTTVAVAWMIAMISDGLGVTTSDQRFVGYSLTELSGGFRRGTLTSRDKCEVAVVSIIEPADDPVGEVEEVRIRIEDDRAPVHAPPAWAATAFVMPRPANGASAGFVSAQGWPLISMAAVWQDVTHDGSWKNGLEISGWSGIQTNIEREAFGPAKALPLRPIWPGFAFNTLFYAAIWFGVFFGFTSAKRIIRAKRGRCPRCGYDLRGSRVEQVSDGVEQVSDRVEQVSDLRGSRRLSEQHESPGAPARRAGETGHGSESRATPGCPECGWGRGEIIGSPCRATLGE